MGVKGSKSHVEARGKSVSKGMILGYSRVTRTVKKTRTVTRTFKKTITKVKKEVIRTTKNGVTRVKTIYRTFKRTITCRSTKRMTSTKTTRS